MNSWQQHLDDNLEKILISEEELNLKIQEMAARITRDYQNDTDTDSELLVIGILRGSVLFMSDLIRHIQLPLCIDFMAVSSYSKGTTSSGTVRVLKDSSTNIENKHVLIVEDIVDTGLTLKNLTEMLSVRKPKSLKICTLLDKPSRRKTEIPVDYCGFQVPDEFVVGYGLDFNDKYRHLPFIGVLKPKAYS